VSDQPERPRCPHCQMPHDLDPDSTPVWICARTRQQIADGVQFGPPEPQPAERCGALLPALDGQAPTECVLRPGHQGSHTNEYDTRWLVKTDAGYCPHCGRGDAGPTADEYEQARRRAVALVERADSARDWARRNLDTDQQAGLLAALRGDQP
jgi:hypothetical protein